LQHGKEKDRDENENGKAVDKQAMRDHAENQLLKYAWKQVK